MSALFAKTEKRYGVVSDLEAFLPADCRDHGGLQAEVQLNDAMALGAGKVMMVMVAFAKAERMGAVRELYPVQHFHPHKLVDGAVDGGSSNARVRAMQLLQQLIRRERRAGMPEAN